MHVKKAAEQVIQEWIETAEMLGREITEIAALLFVFEWLR